MLEELKKKVCKANLDRVAHGLVIFTWGNVSGIDREKGLVVIKPSGVSYDNMKPEDMVVVDLATGKVDFPWLHGVRKHRRTAPPLHIIRHYPIKILYKIYSITLGILTIVFYFKIPKCPRFFVILKFA